MSTEAQLQARSGSKCELCSAKQSLSVYEVPPTSNGEADQSVLVCDHCKNQIENNEALDVDHWRCLNDSMWNPAPVVQVMAWRMLDKLSAEDWAQNLLEMLYLDEDNLAWALALSGDANADNIKHLDSNGAVLAAGDTVTLTKDLTVKGANFTAKRGTAVRGISLVADNADQIEGKISGQQIVILTKFVKKSY
ncbi:MAG: PhnA domain-containing protein [Pseudomonadales bacterium]|nr:PhnA domain-containing protein [Pseudomonadales bacterium]